MTNANMKLVVVNVLQDELETPAPHLDVGEHIITRVVELDKLDAELKGESRHPICQNKMSVR
jgi:ADP-ribose pyrophosphatase